MTRRTIALGELMPARSGTVDPAKHPDEAFELYSIPAFDVGKPDVLSGKHIGSAKQAVQPGDVLLSRIVPHIRRAWMVGPSKGLRILASSEWIVFRGRNVDASYLRRVLVSDPFHTALMQTVSGVGGSLLRARPSYVAQIEIPFPLADEQRRIAKILDKADALRSKRRDAVTQLDKLTQSIFVDMFGDREPTSSTWPTRPLGEMLEFLTSGSRGWASHYAESGDLFLRIQNVKNDELVLSDVAFVRPPDTAEARRTRVQPGDVLLSITADLGRTAVVPVGLGRAYINQHLSILRSSTLVPRFLSRFLVSSNGKEQLAARNRQAVKAGLNFDDVRSVRVPVPPLKLQRLFERRAARVDKLKAQQRESESVLNSLFASLQHRAFRGEL
jgi:type I restriction enzyme, S subunit